MNIFKNSSQACFVMFALTVNTSFLVGMEPQDPQSHEGLSVVFSDDGSRLAARIPGSNNVMVFEVSEGGILSNGYSYALPQTFTNLATGHFGIGGAPNTLGPTRYVESYDNQQEENESVISEDEQQETPVAFSPDGLYLAVPVIGSNRVTIFEVNEAGVLSNGSSYALPHDLTN